MLVGSKSTQPNCGHQTEIQACEAGSTVICSNIVEVNFFYFKIKLRNRRKLKRMEDIERGLTFDDY